MATCKTGYTYTTVGGFVGAGGSLVQGPGCVSGSGDWYFLDTGTQTPGSAEPSVTTLGNTSAGYVQTPTSTAPGVGPAFAPPLYADAYGAPFWTLQFWQDLYAGTNTSGWTQANWDTFNANLYTGQSSGDLNSSIAQWPYQEVVVNSGVTWWMVILIAVAALVLLVVFT